MSLRSWQQTVGMIGFLISISILGNSLKCEPNYWYIIPIFMIFISGLFFGYGMIVPIKEDVKK